MSSQINFLIAQAVENLNRLNLDGANLYLKQALGLQPEHPDALRLLAITVAQRGQYGDALEIIKRVLRIRPKNPLALSNLGSICLALENFDEALDAFDRSIKFDPNYAEAWSNKGNVYFELKKFEKALNCYQKAIELSPNYAEAWSNKGNVYFELREFDKALNCQQRAIELNPYYAEAWYNQGIVFNSLKLLNEALYSYKRTLQINPNHALAHLNQALIMLLLGHFQEGWLGYEWRWRTAFQKDFFREFEVPKWLGEDSLKNKTILVWSEQGLGDAIQIYRFMDKLIDLGANVLLETPKPLVRLFACQEKVACEIIPFSEPIPAFDFHCPLLSLPLAFQVNKDNIPSADIYINLGREVTEIRKWQAKLGLRTKPRIGLVWSGNRNHINDRNRSLSLSELIPFLPNTFEYISLQVEVNDADNLTLQLNPEIRRFEDSLGDFLETAALISQLDLVISVDTSVAHLSGALGKKTWLLLPFVPDWRWLDDGIDTPWYDSMKLYRQSKIHEWSGVLDAVRKDLSDF
jgi:Flp pilus assembly protein TadD